ncbi:MAG TPA: acyltransferase [Armatimonadota bacterium]|nr:acyltransferase [Armatimonadota bacterium]
MDSSRTSHIPGLDGLRGIAILLVLSVHLGLNSFGWVGVQLFFVLSGFLITRILLANRGKTLRDYLLNFYWRRSLRIFPLYYAFIVILTVLYFASTFVRNNLMQGYPHDWPLVFLYQVNFLRTTHDPPGCYAHFWSLAVEEHFYLIWPLLVYCLSKRSLQRTIILLIIACPIIRGIIPLLCTHGALWFVPGREGVSVYVTTLAQFDAFAFGAALCLFDFSKLKVKEVLIAAFAVIIIAGAIFLKLNTGIFSLSSYFATMGFPPHSIDHYQHIVGYTLLNAFFAALVISTVRSERLNRTLAWRPLTFLGMISYGVYVYHPVIQEFIAQTHGKVDRQFFQSGTNFHPILGFISLALVLTIATISYYGFERRFLALKDRWKTGRAVTSRPLVEQRTTLERPSLGRADASLQR